ncbi:MAG TPA: tRNA (5-methylaminomethyl-2-thiouridine)(34)-methyltransferase MnmD [Haliscomenobacter sp.]|uniref:tRNA (5-methylaminomethyl-2-thiouridine)(34)-methyltransferase MnmD n=1 Tax=Haliscomenobacter sp. TaxID=2717303 RepID=UPI001DAE2E5E|nr:tRNA (5-methylaminomethyl-2-thiouridine)(34)-methyltransferase MnmD [Haliscomenobacter sp.]MBK9490480.1 tRNA (5-methylaminomethyl-2-thiouridine)(34)-methyltransferase MnmD [Haliscomenobacter sp.]HOY19359.1 tRNA (5-methylaminomethyl-2-thiouridine)(34)-methyltransferase MnmD [Haliscomenobacter sp.]
MSDGADENEIFVTQDGSHSITAAKFGVSYHSRYGAITESRHVFIQAGLYPLMVNTPAQLSILEIGLGTGLNVLLTYHELDKRPITVYYEALEGFPISPAIAQTLNYPSLIEGSQLQAVFQQLHEGEWNKPITLSPHFQVLKRLGQLEEQSFSPVFDLIYFDAFAPSAQPELWDEAIMQKMYAALKPGGVLVTYCAKGEFKRTLKKVGFTVERLPGPPGKREMTKAVK